MFYNITLELLRLLPYKYITKADEIMFDNKRGTLLFTDKIDFIEEKYNCILNFDKFHDVLKLLDQDDKYKDYPSYEIFKIYDFSRNRGYYTILQNI